MAAEARAAELVQLLDRWVEAEPARQTVQPDLYRLGQWVAAGSTVWRSLPLRQLQPLQPLLQKEAFTTATFAELAAAHEALDAARHSQLSGGHRQRKCWAAASARTAQMAARRQQLRERRASGSRRSASRSFADSSGAEPSAAEETPEPAPLALPPLQEELPAAEAAGSGGAESSTPAGRCYYDFSKQRPVLQLPDGAVLVAQQVRQTDVVEGLFEGQGWRRTPQPSTKPADPQPPPLHTDWRQSPAERKRQQEASETYAAQVEQAAAAKKPRWYWEHVPQRKTAVARRPGGGSGSTKSFGWGVHGGQQKAAEAAEKFCLEQDK